jgi:biopolymer transport protein ExbB
MNWSESPTRRKSLLLVLAFTIYITVFGYTAPAIAQDAAAPPAGQQAAEGKQTENWLFWAARTSGLIGAFILLLSVYFVATVIGLFMEFRLDIVMPPSVVSQADEMLEKKDFAGVYNLLKGDKSFYARVLTAGMAELPNGIKEAQEVADHHSEVLTVEMEKKISMLAVLGTLGPMIGLLGTLKGMISSFGEIARSGTHLDPGKVAEGISEALLLTFEGVLLSVPAIYFFAFFKNRLMSLSANATLQADHFLRKFYAVYKGKTRPAAAEAAK